jgi:ethanolamine ammonia-lyase large subunit
MEPNHPTDDPKGIAVSILDGLMLGSGDAAIGINPATDSLDGYVALARLVDDIRLRLDIPEPGIVDAARNCVSNVRPNGLPIELAAETLRDLLIAAKDRAMTGVALSQQIAREPLAALPPR